MRSGAYKIVVGPAILEMADYWVPKDNISWIIYRFAPLEENGKSVLTLQSEGVINPTTHAITVSVGSVGYSKYHQYYPDKKLTRIGYSKPTPTPYDEDTPMTYMVVNKTERYPKPTPTPYYEDTPMTYRVVNKTERYPKPTEHPKCDYYCSNPINGFEKGSDEAKAARCVKQSRDNQCGKCNFCVEMKKDR